MTALVKRKRETINWEQTYAAAVSTIEALIEARPKKGRWRFALALPSFDAKLEVERRGEELNFWAGGDCPELCNTLERALQELIEGDVACADPEEEERLGPKGLLQDSRKRLAIALQKALKSKRLQKAVAALAAGSAR